MWYFRTVLTMWYFRAVQTMWYFRTVQTMWYFRIVAYFVILVFHIIYFFIFTKLQYHHYQDCQVPSDSTSPTSHEDKIKLFYDIIINTMDIMKTWAGKIPGFCDLCKEDQDLLFKSASLELFVLRIAYR